MNGWVKIHRSILNWQWWPDDNMMRLWIYLLLSANIEDKKWRDIVVKRGQFVTTIPDLSEKTRLSYKTVRTCLERLVESGEIGRQTTNKFSIITICKFEEYQVVECNIRQTNGQSKGRQRADKAKVPPTPPSKYNKNTRIYYYSSLRACTREEKQQKQFFFIFYLKGASNPSEEVENFITWNTTPERVSAWDNCPEYAKYDTARRWKVKGPKMTGFTEKAGKVLTALVDAFIKKFPDFLKGIYSKERYPCHLTEEDKALTLYCSEETTKQLESDLGLVKSILKRFGIEKLYYAQKL